MASENPITLEMIYRAIVENKGTIESVDERLRVLNGSVRQNCTDIAVLKDWRSSHANKVLGQVGDLRVEIAKMGAFGGGFGLVAGLVIALLKGFGVV